MKPRYWSQACQELSAKDPVLKLLISTYRGAGLQSRGNAFETLLRSIVGQQISVKAAQTIWDRVNQITSPKEPQNILGASTPALRSAGLSQRKVEYAQDLAAHFLDGRLQPQRWRRLSDDEVIAELTDVRGIGRWTAEMFLIFHLLRPNVFPRDDLGLQKAISLQYGKRYPLSKTQLNFFEKEYSPWASVATWYLWRSLDPIPVEY